MSTRPTVGRVLHYWQAHPIRQQQTQPWAAIIAHVFSDTMVNLTIFNANGVAMGLTSVQLVRPGEPVPFDAYCEWPKILPEPVTAHEDPHPITPETPAAA